MYIYICVYIYIYIYVKYMKHKFCNVTHSGKSDFFFFSFRHFLFLVILQARY